ncbi:MAG: NAD(P)-dependent oxidoreductase [Candidatus Velthaea sp.]
MAMRIRDGGHSVTAIDSSSVRRDLAKLQGLSTVDSLAKINSAEVIVVMVATPAQLATVVASAVADGVHAGTYCVIMSTVGPRAVIDASTVLSESGIEVLDIPVSGGVSGAAAGKLALFASGRGDALARVRPMLRCLGHEWDCGSKVGSGQAVKLVNQLLCSVNLVAAAEALAFASKLGLERTAVLRMLQSGAAASWMLADRGPRMLASGEVDVTSAVDIFLKDSGLVAEAARDLDFDAPLVNAAHERFRTAIARGLGSRDDSRVIETYLQPARASSTSVNG